jgi:ribulose-phosphate 3-epimerase
MRIWASITSIDLGELVDVGMRLQEAGVDGIHVDVCDGAFVPEITFGHRVVRALTSRLSVPVEAHLMVADPEQQVAALADAGAARIAFHLEATRYPWRVAGLTAGLGVAVGVAVNPATHLSGLPYLSEGVSFVNALTTEPDLVGERLLPRMTERVRQVADVVAPTAVQVDGGLSANALAAFAAAGATEFVVGRALVGATDLAAQLRTVRSVVDEGTGGVEG